MSTDLASEDLANEIEQLLAATEQTQQEVAGLYRDKRAALRRADGPEIGRLTQIEEKLVARLKAHIHRRNEILQRMKAAGAAADSLGTLVRTLDPSRQDGLLAQIEQTRRTAESNRRESWIVWIVSKQSLRLFAEIRELIANGGRRAPVYSARSEGEASFGGAILDASA
jgi:hypothetical protein